MLDAEVGVVMRVWGILEGIFHEGGLEEGSNRDDVVKEELASQAQRTAKML